MCLGDGHIQGHSLQGKQKSYVFNIGATVTCNSGIMAFLTEAKPDRETPSQSSEGLRYTWFFTQDHNKFVASSFWRSGCLISISTAFNISVAQDPGVQVKLV